MAHQAMKRFQIAILLYVEQAGADGPDAYDRALWNLGLGDDREGLFRAHPVDQHHTPDLSCKVTGAMNILGRRKGE